MAHEPPPADVYSASTWYSEKGYQFTVEMKEDGCDWRRPWVNLQGFMDIGYLCVGELVHLVGCEKNDRLGLTIALKQDCEGNSSKRWSFVLFVWMISQEQLNAQGQDYRLSAGKTHILSNWCQVVPYNYVQALPDCHVDADMGKIEMQYIFDVARRGSDGHFKVRSFCMKGNCELSQAIQCGNPNMQLNEQKMDRKSIKRGIQSKWRISKRRHHRSQGIIDWQPSSKTLHTYKSRPIFHTSRQAHTAISENAPVGSRNVAHPAGCYLHASKRAGKISKKFV